MWVLSLAPWNRLGKLAEKWHGKGSRKTRRARRLFLVRRDHYDINARIVSRALLKLFQAFSKFPKALLIAGR